MKYKFALVFAATISVIFACSKTPASQQPESVIDDNNPQAVRFSSNMVASLTTKSAGALDDWTGKDSLYVYGIRKVNGALVFPQDLDNPYDIEDENAFLINNVGAVSPMPAATDTTIYVYRVKSTKEYFFYREMYYYDFFAYYVDDAVTYNADRSEKQLLPKPNVNKEKLTITLPFDITGKEDIMLAKADVAADVDKANKIYNKGAVASKAYGAHSSRRGVVPNLVFEHQLSRFNFFVKAGNQATQDHIILDSLTVKTRRQATLVIASNDASTPIGLTDTAGVARKSVWLQHKDEVTGELVDYTRELGVNPKYYEDNTHSGDVFGEPMMVMPGDKVYEVSLWLHQDDYSIEGGNFKVSLKIDFANLQVAAGQTKDARAEAGHQYDVTMTIFGLQQVDLSVSLTDWKSSGSFTINPDEDEDNA